MILSIMKKVSDETIVSTLASTAPIERFCIYQPGDKSTVSLLFYDPADRNLWVYVHRDDAFVDAAVEYLTRVGTRVLRSSAEEKAYLAKLQQS
jgi:hypothetical protein